MCSLIWSVVCTHNRNWKSYTLQDSLLKLFFFLFHDVSSLTIWWLLSTLVEARHSLAQKGKMVAILRQWVEEDEEVG